MFDRAKVNRLLDQIAAATSADERNALAAHLLISSMHEQSLCRGHLSTIRTRVAAEPVCVVVASGAIADDLAELVAEASNPESTIVFNSTLSFSNQE